MYKSRRFCPGSIVTSNNLLDPATKKSTYDRNKADIFKTVRINCFKKVLLRVMKKWVLFGGQSNSTVLNKLNISLRQLQRTK